MFTKISSRAARNKFSNLKYISSGVIIDTETDGKGNDIYLKSDNQLLEKYGKEATPVEPEDLIKES